jgi:hypothetical protein
MLRDRRPLTIWFLDEEQSPFDLPVCSGLGMAQISTLVEMPQKRPDFLMLWIEPFAFRVRAIVETC